MIKISPSVMTADFCKIGETVQLLDRGGADWIHCDIMDGVFVPNLSFGQPMIRSMRAVTQKPLDVHLMMHDPKPYIEDFVQSGAAIVTVHVESPGCTHIHRVLQSIRAQGALAGVSINPGTAPDVLEYLYGEADLILVMSVNPGFGGQQFIPAALRKIEHIANRLAQLGIQAELEVDGGVKVSNCQSLIDAGATALVAGSAVVDAADPAEAIRLLRGKKERE